MEIIDERTKGRTAIEYLAHGDLFIDSEGDVCMVLSEAGEKRDIKCVSLKDGTVFEEWKRQELKPSTGSYILKIKEKKYECSTIGGQAD